MVIVFIVAVSAGEESLRYFIEDGWELDQFFYQELFEVRRNDNSSI